MMRQFRNQFVLFPDPVVGGLLIGTILSLFDIPIMHAYIDDLTKFLSSDKAQLLNSDRTDKRMG